MIEPIKVKGEVQNNYLAEGKCCICGREWTIKDCIVSDRTFVERYLDGAPKTDVLKYISHPLFCPKCKNASSFESPVADSFGTRDRYNEKGYQDILNSNEPEVIKLWKLAEYRDRGYVNYYRIYTKVFLWLYWYYDSINNMELTKYYSDKIIDAIENHNGKILERIVTKVHQNFIIKKYLLTNNLLLAELYRRKKDFDTAIQYIQKAEDALVGVDAHSSVYDIIELQKKLCLNKQSDKY